MNKSLHREAMCLLHFIPDSNADRPRMPELRKLARILEVLQLFNFRIREFGDVLVPAYNYNERGLSQVA
jgi:hypothetical protein